jgi:hypothetical protein
MWRVRQTKTIKLTQCDIPEDWFSLLPLRETVRDSTQYFHKLGVDSVEWWLTLLEGRMRGWDSAVSIVTCYWLDRPGFESRWGPHFLHPSRLALGPTQSPTVRAESLLGLKRLGCGVDHPPHQVKVKESCNKPGVAQRVPGSLGSQIFMTFGTWRWWGRQPHAPTAFIPRNVPGTHFH